MIKGIHGLFYSNQPEELRAFLRDKLQLPFTDTGGGWLIFDLAEGDLGVHPTDGDDALSGQHDISFYTDDVTRTASELQSRGVELEPIHDHGYGLVTHFSMPGGVRVQLYQPKYTKRSAGAAKKQATPAKKQAAPAKKQAAPAKKKAAPAKKKTAPAKKKR